MLENNCSLKTINWWWLGAPADVFGHIFETDVANMIKPFVAKQLLLSKPSALIWNWFTAWELFSLTDNHNKHFPLVVGFYVSAGAH